MAKGTPKVDERFATLTTDDAAIVADFTDEQKDTLAGLLSLPNNVAMAVVARSLGVDGKRFRQWLRTVRKVGVSGHAAGTERQQTDASDYVAAVKRYCK